MGCSPQTLQCGSKVDDLKTYLELQPYRTIPYQVLYNSGTQDHRRELFRQKNIVNKLLEVSTAGNNPNFHTLFSYVTPGTLEGNNPNFHT